MIDYIFRIESDLEMKFSVDTDRTTGKDDPGKLSPWTELGYYQCECCTLSPDENRHCPAAADLHHIIADFSPMASYETAEVSVVTEEREYRKTCDIQTGLQSLLGLIMATSACPVLSKLRLLADFHLPFSTSRETIFRIVSAYLLNQYFILSEGGETDFELRHVEQFCMNLEELNRSFSERIRVASESDANLCAMVQWGSVSFMMRASLREQLEKFRRLNRFDL